MCQRKLAAAVMILMGIIASLVISNCYLYDAAPLVRHKRTLLTALAVARGVSNVADEVISHISEDAGYDIDYTINNGLQATIKGSINTLPKKIPLSIPSINSPQLMGSINVNGTNKAKVQVGASRRSNIDDYNYAYDSYDAYDYVEY